MEKSYLDLLEDILENGEERVDRTGVGTLSVFGRQIRCHLKDGFPLLTTKKVNFKAVLGELLWFLEGSSDERRLAEITYGTRDPSQKTIWSPNAERTSGSKFKPAFQGDLGRIYGVQWRKWKHVDVDRSEMRVGAYETEHDQIANIISTLKSNPTDRRMILTAWNPGEINLMALPPCHMTAIFNVNIKKQELNCLMTQRSCDTFLGLPFNIASYALLTHMMAHVSNLNPGELILSLADTHIYLNHIDQVKEQLTREILPSPTIHINPDVTDIDGFLIGDIFLENYRSHDSIKAPMAN